MATDDFFDKPFDEGTLTKLRVFELYAREWLPVFLSRERPHRSRIHIFDFFAGPGTDKVNQAGSPLRLLKQLQEYRTLPGWNQVKVHVHFFDESEDKIVQLTRNIVSAGLRLPNVEFDIRSLAFDQAFAECRGVLGDAAAVIWYEDDPAASGGSAHLYATFSRDGFASGASQGTFRLTVTPASVPVLGIDMKEYIGLVCLHGSFYPAFLNNRSQSDPAWDIFSGRMPF